MSTRYSKGFTVTELIVVVVVIGILAAITVVSYTMLRDQAAVASVKSDLTNLSDAAKLMTAENTPLYSSTSWGSTWKQILMDADVYNQTAQDSTKAFIICATEREYSIAGWYPREDVNYTKRTIYYTTTGGKQSEMPGFDTPTGQFTATIFCDNTLPGSLMKIWSFNSSLR